MQQNHEILLSTGTQFVSTCEIPALIAKALHPTDFLTDTPLLHAEILQCNVEDEHKRLLRTAIATGQLEQLSPATHIPTNHYLERGKVPVEALSNYVARFKIGVRFPKPIDSCEALNETPAERRAKLDMSTERGCRRLILENWDTIEKLHRQSIDARKVMRIIERNKDKDQKAPALKTVQNTLNTLRNEKLIP